MLLIIIYIAKPIINADNANPLDASITRRVYRESCSEPKVVNIVDSSVSTETQAAAREIILDAESMGLLCLRCFIAFIIDIVNDVKVYVAIVIVVISL